MEATIFSSTAVAEGFDPDFEKQTSSDHTFPYANGEIFDEDDEDHSEEEVFEENTFSDGESILASKLDAMLSLPRELQQEKPSTSSKQKEVALEIEEEEEFEQFDVVQDCSDHHFANRDSKPGNSKEKMMTKLLNMLHIIKSPGKTHEGTSPAAGCVRRIQQEWKSLEKDLPEGVYVRVYEERMDLLRAAIVGPSGTPYHDGLFFFDFYIPASYPGVPPVVYYHAHGLRLNPNLYASGKVCLSLLGTWKGRGCEMWSSKRSTLLQVLVSIQAIVFNPKPYFNEPFVSRTNGTPLAEKKSLCYNEVAFLLSCKTMLYTLRQPPKHFEGLVVSHFRRRGRAILLACKAYMEGATVGSGGPSAGVGAKKCSAKFHSSLKIYLDRLAKELKATGADCTGLLA